MVHEVGPSGESLHVIDVATIRFLEFDPFGEIVEIGADHIVAASDLVARLNERVGEVAAEESGSPGNEYFHY